MKFIAVKKVVAYNILHILGENRSTVSSIMSLTGSLRTEATGFTATCSTAKSNAHLADVLLHKDAFTAKFNSLTELVITMTNFLSTRSVF